MKYTHNRIPTASLNAILYHRDSRNARAFQDPGLPVRIVADSAESFVKKIDQENSRCVDIVYADGAVMTTGKTPEIDNMDLLIDECNIALKVLVPGGAFNCLEIL